MTRTHKHTSIEALITPNTCIAAHYCFVHSVASSLKQLYKRGMTRTHKHTSVETTIIREE